MADLIVSSLAVRSVASYRADLRDRGDISAGKQVQGLNETNLSRGTHVVHY